MSEEPDELGYHVISGTLLLESLLRVEKGEKASLVYAELWANADHEQVDPPNWGPDRECPETCG